MQLEAILRLELAAIRSRLEQRGLALEIDFTDRALRRLLAEGTDREHGARPLKRVLERRIVFPLARLLASRQLVGGEVLRGDWPDEAPEVEFVLTAVRRLAASAG